MTDNKKPTAGFWITVALVVVLVGYGTAECACYFDANGRQKSSEH